MRHTIAAAALLLMVAVSDLWGAPQAAALPAESGVDRFGGCIAAEKSGQVLVMIDESGSLTETDPRDERVAAATYLVRQLAQFTEESGVALKVAVAGFSDSYHEELSWTDLDASNLSTVESSLEAFRDRTSGQDTDYWVALDGARSTLAASAPPSPEGQQCQALAWFTDGKLDFNQRGDAEKPYAPGLDLNSPDGVAATAAAAQESICRDRGLADQLRSSGVITFAIGLSSDPAQVSDFDLLKAIATGQPSGGISSCGAIRSPTPGDFYLAQNIDDLLFAFDEFSTPGQAPTRYSTGACARVICEEAKHRFVLDRSVRAVSVLAAADRVGLVPHLVAPDGTSAALAGGPATIDVGGVSVDYLPQGDKSVSFRMTGPSAPQWQGAWALVFVDPNGDAPATTRSSIHISGDLYPAWPDAEAITIHSGDSDVAARFSVVDSRQQPVDPTTLLGRATLSVTFLDSSGTPHPLLNAVPKDVIAQPQSLSFEQVPPGGGTLRMTLDVTTADAVTPQGAVVPGTVLAPQRVDLPIRVDSPVGYPKVGERIDFGAVEGAGSFSATLPITGPGCAWLSPAETRIQAVPDGVGETAVTSAADSADTCVKPGDGSPGALPVDIEVPTAGNGAINGTVTVMAAPADGSAEPIPVVVPFTMELAKPLNTLNLVLALVAALLLGPGIPLLLLYLAKYAVTRIPANALRAQEIPVRLAGGAVTRDGGPFTVRDGELVNLVSGLDKPARRLQIGEVTLRTHLGWSPFGSGYVVASAPGRVGAAGRSGSTHGSAPDAKLPLAVHNTWFVLHDPAGPSDHATVVLLVSGDADRSRIRQMTEDVASSLPQVLPQLRTKAAPGAPGADAGDIDSPFSGVGPAERGGNPFGGGAAGAGSFRGPATGLASPPPFNAAPPAPEADRGNPFGSTPFGSGPSSRSGESDNPFQ